MSARQRRLRNWRILCRRCFKEVQRSSTRSVHLNSFLYSSTLKINFCPRYQIITQHGPYEIICEDTNLGFERTDKLVFIQIFQQGRNAELKQAIYAELQKRLEKDCGVPGTDLISSCSANTPEDWIFGLGRAQFLTGDL
jgi:hypothetical protein